MTSRAVLRVVEPGQRTKCVGCNLDIKWTAKGNRRQRRVVANVYAGGKWSHVEVWHPQCYEQAGQPHGATA